MYQGIGNKSFLADRFSPVTNFGCETSGECKKKIATIRECALVSAEPTNQKGECGPDGGFKKMSVARKRINNEFQSPSFLGNVFNIIFDNPDGTSLDQIPKETHVASPAVLKNWIDVTTGWSRNHRNRTKHALQKSIEI